MDNSSFLQLFLLANVFAIGFLAAVAVRHAYAHFRPDRHDNERRRPAAQTVHLPPAVKEHLLEKAAANFQRIINHSATELETDLKHTSTMLSRELEKLGQDVIRQEAERHHAMLEELRAKTVTALESTHNSIVQHQAELDTAFAEQRAQLETKLAEEIAAEKDRLVQQIDTKLADAVTSFLTDTLQHDIDLGAQSAYLINQLEQHKAELAKSVRDEV